MRKAHSGCRQGLRALRVLPAACPTYSLWGEEMDSPRGRIHLVGQLLDGAPLTAGGGRALRPVPWLHGLHDRLPVRGAVRPDHRGGAGVDRGGSASFDEGSDGLGPAGVAPGGAVPEARRPLRDRLTRAAIFALFPYPGRLRVATAPLRAAAADRGRPADRADRPGRAGLPRGRAGAAARAARDHGDAVRAVARAGGGARGAAGRRRHAHRVRAVGVLPPGERRDGAGARRRGMRRDHPAFPGVLRRAVAALRAGRRGRQVRASGPSRRSRRQPSTRSSSTRPAAGRR